MYKNVHESQEPKNPETAQINSGLKKISTCIFAQYLPTAMKTKKTTAARKPVGESQRRYAEPKKQTQRC